MFTSCIFPRNNSATSVADMHTHENLARILDIFGLSGRLQRNQSTIENVYNDVHMCHIVLFKNNVTSDHIVLPCNTWQYEMTFSSLSGSLPKLVHNWECLQWCSRVVLYGTTLSFSKTIPCQTSSGVTFVKSLTFSVYQEGNQNWSTIENCSLFLPVIFDYLF